MPESISRNTPFLSVCCRMDYILYVPVIVTATWNGLHGVLWIRLPYSTRFPADHLFPWTRMNTQWARPWLQRMLMVRVMPPIGLEYTIWKMYLAQIHQPLGSTAMVSAER